MEDEARFPFDVEEFQRAVDQMSNSISSMENKLNDFGGTMQKSVSKGIVNATAKIGLLVKGFKSVMKNIPEIGQAFKIAGDIVNKEFFFPIRQQIMPYLQKMLDWVRDHRALFAKWGQAVADVLKTVIDVGKTLYNTLKDVVKILTNSLQKGLGTSFKSLDEFISVLQVKIAFVTLLIGDVIKTMFEKIAPVFEYIIEKGSEVISFFVELFGTWTTGNDTGKNFTSVMNTLYSVFNKIVHTIGDSVISFFEGLTKPLGDLSVPLAKINEAFQRLLNLFGDGENTGIKKAFSWLGNFVGNQLLVEFEAFAVILDTVVTAIQTLAQSGNLIKDIFTGNWDALSQDWDSVKDLWKDYGGRTKESGGRMWSDIKSSVGIDDGIITKKGQIIKLNPNDNIYAFKDARKAFDGDISKQSINTENLFNDNTQVFNNETPKLDLPVLRQSLSAPMNMVFNVTVTEGNAQTVGQQLGLAIHKSFVDRLKEQQMAGGW